VAGEVGRDKGCSVKESEFLSQVIETAQLLGWACAHFRGVRIQRKDGSCYYATPVQADGEGFPDLLLLKGKKMICLECKVGGRKPTERQMRWLSMLARVPGIECYVCRPKDWPEIEMMLKGGREVND
jgi:hypothetical protein